MTEADVRSQLSGLPGARILIASKEEGSPEAAWGDSFCYFDPDSTRDQKWPFATIVTNDTPGWDEVSSLSSSPDRFRVNLDVGREHQPEVPDPIDYSESDRVLPHPQYAAQGWVSIVNPGPRTESRLRELVEVAHQRAASKRR